MYRLILSIIFILAITGCKQSAQISETALDAGRNFIRASLDGNFAAAEDLLYKDSSNNSLFERFRLHYNQMPNEEKDNYKIASYEINKYMDVNDSTTIINFSNSFMKKPMEIKLIRKNSEWLVDFKYTYSGNLPIN